jgi:Lar family restriction alleviation protein
MSKLLPCPFCGKQPSIETEKRAFAIMCLTPDCGEVMSRWFMTEDEAVAAWNTRAPVTFSDPDEEVDLDCEYDPDGSYALIWKNGYAITAFPNGRVCITKSPLEPGIRPIGCDVSELVKKPA